MKFKDRILKEHQHINLIKWACSYYNPELSFSQQKHALIDEINNVFGMNMDVRSIDNWISGRVTMPRYLVIYFQRMYIESVLSDKILMKILLK